MNNLCFSTVENEDVLDVGTNNGALLVFIINKGGIACGIEINKKALEIAKLTLKENNFKFEKGLYHEDFGLIPLAILKAKTFVSTDICGYNYVQRIGSIMSIKDNSKVLKKLNDLLVHYDNITEKIERYDIKSKTKEDVKIFCTNSILLRVNDLEKKDKKNFSLILLVLLNRLDSRKKEQSGQGHWIIEEHLHLMLKNRHFPISIISMLPYTRYQTYMQHILMNVL